MSAPRRTFAVLLTIAFVVGLLVRIGILAQTVQLPTRIADEQQYARIAHNLVTGNGFAWDAGRPTSLRPPLYPFMLAALWSILGTESLQAVRVVQIALALATSALLYTLGSRVYNRTVGCWAAAICWLYPSFIFFNVLVLTETLFTFLLVAFLLLTVALVQGPRRSTAIACGIALGLAALTRSILWPLPILLCPLLMMLVEGAAARRALIAALVLAGYAVVVTPWAIRNTKLQGVVTIVDTMGGMNLRMGNYEYTPDDRMWDAVALGGEKSWVYGLPAETPGQPITEGRKEKWAQRKAIEYMREHPLVTARRSLIKFADFWGLEREFVAGVQTGLYAPPFWFYVLGTVAVVLGYAAVVVAGAAGLWLVAPADRRLHVLLLLPVLVLVGAHTIVFGHSRYHLPLIPIFAIYAAAFVTARPLAVGVFKRPLLVGAAATVSSLFAVWIRQIAIVDAARIAALLGHVG